MEQNNKEVHDILLDLIEKNREELTDLSSKINELESKVEQIEAHISTLVEIFNGLKFIQNIGKIVIWVSTVASSAYGIYLAYTNWK